MNIMLESSQGKIGPNAIVRMAEAMQQTLGDSGTAWLFAAAGLGPYLRHWPEDLVDEDEVIRLHRLLRESVGLQQARQISRKAGARTADDLLAHRIPVLVQILLHVLPHRTACQTLLNSIRRHAWTFVGSGKLAVLHGPPLQIHIVGNPLCRDTTASEPICDYYAACFERLFDRLVRRGTKVREVACAAMGAPACVFEFDFS
jgi:divinyl protochlorophyllide a 8-vinyl-reductase